MVTRRKSFLLHFTGEISTDDVGLLVRDLGARQGVKHFFIPNDALSRIYPSGE